MKLEQYLFFGSVLLVCYTWVGYAALLWIASQVTTRRPVRRKAEPSVSIIIAVHNEESHIAAKLENCLALEYSPDRLEIFVASDGSTDDTERIVLEFMKRDSRICLLKSERREGKSGVQNLAARHAAGEVLFFTDAETRTQAGLLRQIAEDFADPEVGVVAPIVYFGEPDGAVAQGQGIYWRYELFLRQMESDIGILATASGAALAIRRELFRPLPLQYGDDCILPLDVRLRGRRVLQDSRAIVVDTMPHTIEGEFKARVRMTARNWAGTLSRNGVLNPFRFPATSFGLVSHKLLRWLTPILLALGYITNTLLFCRSQFGALWILQTCFYTTAFVGWRLTLQQRCARVFAYPFAFCLANVGFLAGLIQVLRRQVVITYK